MPSLPCTVIIFLLSRGIRDTILHLTWRGSIFSGWRGPEEPLVGLVEGEHDEQDWPRGAEEEGDDGHEADLCQGRGEGEAEGDVGHPYVLDRSLEADGNDLGPTLWVHACYDK